MRRRTSAPQQSQPRVRRGDGIDQIIFLSDLIDAPLDAELAALEKAMEVATRQRGRALALAQLIESAAQRAPQLLVVEDVHWADTDELARFGEIAAVVANCPILFIMTTRPEGDPISATWRARARGCPVTTVDLAPLADDEAQELAAHYPELRSEDDRRVHSAAPKAIRCFSISCCVRRVPGTTCCRDRCARWSSRAQIDCRPGSRGAAGRARARTSLSAGSAAPHDRPRRLRSRRADRHRTHALRRRPSWNSRTRCFGTRSTNRR